MNWEILKAASLDEVLNWAESEPWCLEMSGCAQDAQWHSEGDVWTHTKMVCDQLLKLDEWKDLAPTEKSILIFTALFHDSAKPLTSKVDSTTGRITTPNHAVKGELLARNVLRELGCDLLSRESIAGLVRYHGRPAFLLDKPDPQHEVVRLSWLVSNRLLYLFAIADTRGRDTQSMNRPEENLNYWKLQAQELSCFDQRYSFSNDHSRFLFFREAEPNLHYEAHEKFTCNVTLMSGLPGSGKDTWLAQNRSELPVVSLDEIRRELGVDPSENQGAVAQLARERCREFLRAGNSFAFNATNTLRQTRKRWIDLFSDYHARVEIVYLEPPFDEILRRNRSREKSVPVGVIQKLAAKCEPPTPIESHSLTLV